MCLCLDDVEASVFAGVGRTAAKVRDYGVSADINCNAVKNDRKVRVVHKITELVPASTGILIFRLFVFFRS